MRAGYWIAGGAALALALFAARRAAAAELPAGDRAVSLPDGSTAIRGLRNNNPGNLRPNPHYKWQGQLGSDDRGYLIFDTMANGLRAVAVDILNQQERNGLDTVRAIITKYAPPTDDNPTDAYIANVAGALGVDPDDTLTLTDPAQLGAFVRAVVRQENGSAADDAISDRDVAAGVAAAIAHVGAGS